MIAVAAFQILSSACESQRRVRKTRVGKCALHQTKQVDPVERNSFAALQGPQVGLLKTRTAGCGSIIVVDPLSLPRVGRRA